MTNYTNLIDKKNFFKLTLIYFFSIFLNLFEFFTLGSIPIFLSIMLGNETFKFIEDILISLNFSKSELTKTLLIIILILFITKNILNLLYIYLENNFFKESKKYISDKLFTNYLNTQYINFIKRKPSDLIRNINTEIDHSVFYLLNKVILFRECILILTILILIWLNDSVNILLIFLFLSSISLFFLWIIKKHIKKISLDSIDLRSSILKTLNETFDSIKDIKILNGEDLISKNFSNIINKYEKVRFKFNMISKSPRIFIEFISVISFVVFVLISLSRNIVLIDLIPILGLLVISTFRLIPSFSLINTSINNIRMFKVSHDFIFNELNLNDFKKKELLNSNKNMFSENIKSFELRKINFSYKSEKEILDNINFKINKGEMIGIFGESGEGKTTLLHIIMGLLEQKGGLILINEKKQNLNNLNWNKKLGYVPQDIYLLDDTIEKNIAFCNDEKEIDIKKINYAIEKSKFDSVLRSNNQNLKNIIGNKGFLLSGGQRQRLGVARALYHKPELLVLDEATSSLDEDTEKNMMENLQEIKKDCSIIFVTHKAYLKKYFDKIYTLKNKKLDTIN